MSEKMHKADFPLNVSGSSPDSDVLCVFFETEVQKDYEIKFYSKKKDMCKRRIPSFVSFDSIFAVFGRVEQASARYRRHRGRRRRR